MSAHGHPTGDRDRVELPRRASRGGPGHRLGRGRHGRRRAGGQGDGPERRQPSRPTWCRRSEVAASAPSPGWLLRAAEASCVATLITMRAAMLGIDLDTLEVTVDSVSDDRGLLGVDDTVPAGPADRPRRHPPGGGRGGRRRSWMPSPAGASPTARCATPWSARSRSPSRSPRPEHGRFRPRRASRLLLACGAWIPSTAAVMPPRAVRGPLLLADIGGYTSFLQSVAVAHQDDAFAGGKVPDAYALVSSLLDGIVGQIVPPFTLSKLEGRRGLRLRRRARTTSRADRRSWPASRPATPSFGPDWPRPAWSGHASAMPAPGSRRSTSSSSSTPVRSWSRPSPVARSWSVARSCSPIDCSSRPRPRSSGTAPMPS